MRSWGDNLQLRHSLSAPLVLVAVVLAVYAPALSGGLHTIDDPGIVELYSSSPPLSQIMVPGSGYYYRPLLDLTFWLDNLLWGMQPRVMHLENVLLHCLNTLLVFLLARRVAGTAPSVSPAPPAASPLLNALPLSNALPLGGALLFALHPVNVEAVSWIAGRSDPLLCTLLLSACWFWLRWLERPAPADLAATLFLFVAALLTKETALAAGPVALLLAFAWPGESTVRQRVRALAMMASPALLLVLFALVFRGGSSGLSRFLVSEVKGGEGIWQGVVAFGFYARKLLLPVPLNFAITEAHPLYGLLGLALLPALLFFLLRRRLPGALLVSAALFVLPAVVVAVKQVAWTPYAERYLYLPSAFFVLGLVACSRGERPLRRAPLVAALLILAGSASVTFSRNLLWNDKLAFVQDTIAKSPEHGSLYSQLGGILLERGELKRAEEAFATADRLNRRESVRLIIKANLMGVKVAQQDFAGARAYFFQLFTRKSDADANFLELLHRADTRRLVTLGGEEKKRLAQDLLETLDLLLEKRYDPFWLYRSGQLWLELGDRQRAADCFARALSAAPADAHYRPAAGIYLQKLGRTK